MLNEFFLCLIKFIPINFYQIILQITLISLLHRCISLKTCLLKLRTIHDYLQLFEPITYNLLVKFLKVLNFVIKIRFHKCECSKGAYYNKLKRLICCKLFLSGQDKRSVKTLEI
jgi:hypothetical protein